MKEKVGIIAGILTFLGFSAVCVWHHAGTSDALLSHIPTAATSPSTPSHAPSPSSSAVVPMSTSVVESPPVVASIPPVATASFVPQSRPEPLTQDYQHNQPKPIPALRGKVIEFFADSDVLTPRGREALGTLLSELRSTPVQQIEIAGHTDNLGTEDYNRDLSQRRAETVKHYFITQGVAEHHLIAQGYGSSLPIADNATAEGRQRNRRTEIIIHRTASGS